MITVCVSELKGAALDWAIAKCEGFAIEYEKDRNDFWVTRTNHAQQFLPPFGYLSEVFHPSDSWSQGGEIIEREKVCVEYMAGAGDGGLDVWVAEVLHEDRKYGGVMSSAGQGPTPLIAAMRCYVTSKLGENIDIPDELYND